MSSFQNAASQQEVVNDDTILDEKLRKVTIFVERRQLLNLFCRSQYLRLAVRDK